MNLIKLYNNSNTKILIKIRNNKLWNINKNKIIKKI